MASLTELLLATQDPTKCAAAEAQIRQAESQSVEQYFTALAQELANAEKPQIARQLAGLLLKNGLFAKDATRDREQKARWASLSPAVRSGVKDSTTAALIATEPDVGKAAAQVLSKIGRIEIPAGEWPGLVPLLLQHVTNNDPRAKQIALTTLGYLCEELVKLQDENATFATTTSNEILTAVVQGMRDPDPATKLEAVRSFYHAVVLAKTNFRNPNERDMIMTVLVECCKFTAAENVQIAAFECLVQVATEYYDFMMPYMNAVGPLTWETIRTASERVSIPAMEFWSTLCDEELDLKFEAEAGGGGERKSLNLIAQALQFLLPLLTEMMTRRQSEEDDDTWNLANASGTCLDLVAQVVGDQCVDAVLGFVQANFGNADWKFREAGILAFGSIMEGPSDVKMGPLVQQAYPALLNLLDDQCVAVRDTVAWTLGRIAQFHPTIMPVKQIIPTLGKKLVDTPRVAANVCWVIQVIAECEPQGPLFQPQPTGQLSEFFTALAQGLIGVTGRPDATERNLRMAAYNALSVLISRVGEDCLVYMEQLVPEMLNHLANPTIKAMDRECDIQGYICGVLTSLVNRLGQKVLPAADRIMEETLKVIVAYQQAKGAPCLLEEALLLVISLANAVSGHFERFMPHFAPHLTTGLQNYEDVQVCFMATGCVCDLSRALGGKIMTYCDTILQLLYVNLQNPAVDRKIKAGIMSCFGDIAMAIQGEFEKCLAPVVQMLLEASGTKLSDGPADNEEWVEYLSSLREGVLDAYIGIIHGLKDGQKLHLFKPHVNAVLVFVQICCEDQTSSDSVMKACVGVLGDLISSFQAELTSHLGNAPFLNRLSEFASRSTDQRTMEVSQYLRTMLAKYGAGGIQP